MALKFVLDFFTAMRTMHYSLKMARLLSFCALFPKSQNTLHCRSFFLASDQHDPETGMGEVSGTIHYKIGYDIR